MEKRKLNAFNLGAKGYVIVILTFVSCYLYSALSSDSLNITIAAFGARGLDTNIIYSLSTIATICGIVGSIIIGKIMTIKATSKIWGVCLLGTAVFSIVWSFAYNIVVYTIAYLLCYTLSMVCGMLLGYQIIAFWFPQKRGVAMGICTIGYPISACTTTAVCNYFNNGMGINWFYYMIALIAAICGVLVLIFVKDFPEQRGAYPDNDKTADFKAALKEQEMMLENRKNSKWTIGKVLGCGRTWIVWVAISIGGLLSGGIMANFFNRYAEMGYEVPSILSMLTIAGVIAIPGSVIIGWIDAKLGTKVTAIILNILSVIAVAFNLTSVHALHYIALPILGIMLGGSSNMLVSCVSAIWGRYDFQNAFRVLQPMHAVANGAGITIVGLIGTNVSYSAAYWVLLGLAVIALIAVFFLKLTPIDQDKK